MTKRELNSDFKKREKKFNGFITSMPVKDMAKALGVTRSHMYNWISRKTYPRASYAKKIIEFSKFRLDMNDIYNFKY